MLKPNIRSLSISSQESYSAVMIADLVAEVPVSIETDHGSAKPAKEETNLGYDGQLDGGGKSPTVDGTDSTLSHVTNGGGITRGVILNAVQFGQPDSKTKSDEKTTTLPVPSLPQQISEPKGFKDMSIPRKIAFGVSFLPSVLFVLCFSIILPCNVLNQCVEELWTRTFNHTEAISRLETPENLMFTAAVQGNKSVLLELHKYSGIDMRTLTFDTNSAYLTCGKIMNATKTDCLIMDEEGKFFSISDSHSKFLWNPISEESEHPSNPVILSDCNSDGVDEVALVVSNTKIKIRYTETIASTYEISDCDSYPTNLTPWVINGSSDIVFICKKNGEDKLVKVPKNMWCVDSENSQDEALILHNGTMDSLNKAKLLPVEEGLVLWSEDEVSMIQPNGSLLWKMSNTSHSEENQYILYGNFNGENKQVALLSSSIASGLQVTLLDSSDGNQIKSFSFPDSEATDVVTVHGKKKDFIIILKKEVKQSTDIMTTALTQINDISTTIVSLASNEEVPRVMKPTSQEVAILNMKGELTTVKELKDLQDAEYKTTMTAVYDESIDVLHIYLLSTSENNESDKTTKVRNINIADWNKSKMSKCLGKVIEN